MSSVHTAAAAPPPPLPVHTVPNAAIARCLEEIADALDIEGENPFRVRAYRNAARCLETLAQPVAEIAAAGGREALLAIPGVGESMADKILEMLETGALAQLREVRREVPHALSALLGIEGLGPKKLHLLHEKLGVEDLDDLERVVRGGDVLQIRGFGERSRQKLLQALEKYRVRSGRFLLSEAEPWAEALCGRLARVPGVSRVEAAGSLRRRKETVGDLDLLCAASGPAAAVAAFTGFDAVEEVLAQGATKASVRLATGLQVDLRVIDPAVFGAALHYFTGSKEHNIALRTLAKEKGYKVSEYGAFRGRRRVAGRTEEEIFALIGAGFIPPELRENRGEIEAAIAGTLPELIDSGDLRGDLQMHTGVTDGRNTAGEMARAARALGREYIAITEHSKAVTVAGGLDDSGILKNAAALRRLRVPGLRVLAGVEVDILRDGTLDLAPETLRRLDLVVASVHSALNLPREEMTRRVLRAVESGLVHVLGHPTGRLLNEREPFEIDMKAVIEACVRHGVALEINAHPERLDLSDVHAKLARDLGAKLVISTDAHSVDELGLLRYGVGVARRAWLTRGDVLNTLPVERLLRALGRVH
ncbi:MAG TPA: DNA polymerase/3'-5' exonuclease PolX [Thermoanaerobaculia bacterium]|nr:DNA polymerase/3'-5' exonuclease PolX [Thermoanaerobaculia bacterium]